MAGLSTSSGAFRFSANLRTVVVWRTGWVKGEEWAEVGVRRSDFLGGERSLPVPFWREIG